KLQLVSLVGRNKALRASASKAFPAVIPIVCRKRHHALRLGGLIPAYKRLTVGMGMRLERYKCQAFLHFYILKCLLSKYLPADSPPNLKIKLTGTITA
ncbi:MAG: hypothetical protein WCP66_10340, partial [Methylococcales bacterium]